MSEKPLRMLGVALVTVVVAASCSGADGDATLVTLEARWLCDVQRQTFDDLPAIEAELEGRLATEGLTWADYDLFKERLNSSSDLRTTVSEEYDAYCLS